jgi:hypothetical protein
LPKKKNKKKEKKKEKKERKKKPGQHLPSRQDHQTSTHLPINLAMEGTVDQSSDDPRQELCGFVRIVLSVYLSTY